MTAINQIYIYHTNTHPIPSVFSERLFNSVTFIPTYRNAEFELSHVLRPGPEQDSVKLHFLEDESLGPSISTVYAKFVEDCCRKRILTSELVKLKELFQRPENCPALSVPTINPDLWAQLPKDQKEHDKRLQSAQGLLAKGLTGVIEVKETLLQFNTNPDKFPTLFKELNEKHDACVAILGNAHLETSFRRRDMLKSALNPRFHSLCSTKTR